MYTIIWRSYNSIDSSSICKLQHGNQHWISVGDHEIKTIMLDETIIRLHYWFIENLIIYGDLASPLLWRWPRLGVWLLGASRKGTVYTLISYCWISDTHFTLNIIMSTCYSSVQVGFFSGRHAKVIRNLFIPDLSIPIKIIALKRPQHCLFS